MPLGIRPYGSEDLGEVVEHRSRAHALAGATQVHPLHEVLSLVDGRNAVVLVAERDRQMLGASFAAVSGTLGWIHAITAEEPGAAAVLARLIERIEAALAKAPTQSARWSAGEGPWRGAAYERVRGRRGRRMLSSRGLEGRISQRRPSALGAVTIDQGLWDRLKGMDEPKDIIERRVILPLAEPALAEHHGVERPKAIVLFGPPGTGETAFAKGIASRLGWPFVQIEPSELVEQGVEHESRLLAETAERILELPSAVVWFDHVLPVGPDADARAPRKAARSAFERDVFEQAGVKASTEEFLDAIRQTRPTLSRELIDEFEGDVERFARH